MNRISARGFGLGYIGSTIPFIISIAIILLAQKEIIPVSTPLASKIAFIITAVWWGIFTIPMIKNVHQHYYIKREPKPIINSFKRLGQTFKDIRKVPCTCFYSYSPISSILMELEPLFQCPLHMELI